MTPIEAAYIAGIKARDVGKAVTANPHHSAVDLRDAWTLGWESRKRGHRSKAESARRIELGLTTKITTQLRCFIKNERMRLGWLPTRMGMQRKIDALSRSRDELMIDNQSLRSRIRALEAENKKLRADAMPARRTLAEIAGRLAA